MLGPHIMTERAATAGDRPGSVLEEQLAVLRQRPEVVGDERLELVDDLRAASAWAGMTSLAKAFASAWTVPASCASCWACPSASMASTSESARPVILTQMRVDALRRRGRRELTEVAGDGRQDHRRGDVDRGVRLDVDDLDVALPVDLDARGELALGQHAEAREQRLGGLGRQRRQGVDGRLVVRQPAAGGLGVPLLGVVVALEQDLLVGP